MSQHICSQCIDELTTAYSLRQRIIVSDIKRRKTTSEVLSAKIKEERVFAIPLDFEFEVAIDESNYETCVKIEPDEESEQVQEDDWWQGNHQEPLMEDIELVVVENLPIRNATQTGPKKANQSFCFICHSIFDTLADKAFHLKEEHSQFNSCPVCKPSVKFTTAKAYDCHMKEHVAGVNRRNSEHTCDRCGYIASCFANIRKHLTVTHLQIRDFSCDECEKTFSTKSALIHHEIVLHGAEPTIRCKKCGKGFHLTAVHKLHIKSCNGVQNSRRRKFNCATENSNDKQKLEDNENNEKQKRFSCHICNKTFHAPGFMRQHMFVAHKNNEYCCKFCPKEFDSYQEGLEHLQSHSKKDELAPIEGIKKFQCYICNLVFRKRKRKERHVAEDHVNDAFRLCSLCGADNFKTPMNHEQHVKEHFIAPVKLACHYCGKLLHKHLVTSHIREVHESSPASCDICGYSSSRLNLKNHIENKHLKLRATKSLGRFPCELCSSVFNLGSSLRNHMFRSHGMEPRFRCRLCGSGFTNVYPWKNHEIVCANGTAKPRKLIKKIKLNPVRTGLLNTSTFPPPKIVNGLRICTLCEREFPSENGWSNHHFYKHTHNCRVCFKIFANFESLRFHMYDHEVFSCKVCSKIYNFKNTMLAHQRLHNKCGFSCDVCLDLFKNQEDLHEHVSILH